MTILSEASSGAGRPTDLAAALAAVERPIAEAQGLPNWLYTEAEAFRLEREQLFAPTWACIGSTSRCGSWAIRSRYW